MNEENISNDLNKNKESVCKCKYCNSNRINKMGTIYGKKRFLCRDCKRTFREGKDNRIKYSNKKRMKAIKMVLEGIGIRSIERLENIPNTLILRWIKNFGSTIKDIVIEDLNNIPDDIKKEDIEILEGDEIVTYVKKNSKMEDRTSGYGFLLTEEGIKLLIFK